MEQGILFSELGKAPLEYQKSFCFAETPKSTFWDDEEENLEETTSPGEAKYYDAIAQQFIFAYNL